MGSAFGGHVLPYIHLLVVVILEVERVLSEEIVVQLNWEESDLLRGSTCIVDVLLGKPFLLLICLSQRDDGRELLAEFPEQGVVCLELNASQGISSDASFLFELASFRESESFVCLTFEVYSHVLFHDGSLVSIAVVWLVVE